MRAFVIVCSLELALQTLHVTTSQKTADASGCGGGHDGVFGLGDQGRSHRGRAQRLGVALGRPGRTSGTARGELRGMPPSPPQVIEITPPDADSQTRSRFFCVFHNVLCFAPETVQPVVLIAFGANLAHYLQWAGLQLSTAKRE